MYIFFDAKLLCCYYAKAIKNTLHSNVLMRTSTPKNYKMMDCLIYKEERRRKKNISPTLTTDKQYII